MIAAISAWVGARIASRSMPELPSWQRKNFAGKSTSLTGGIDAAVGLIAGSVIAGKDANKAACVASVGAALGGYVDDHWEEAFPATAKGFRGHVSSACDGQPTSGLVKIVATGTGALGAAIMLGRARDGGLLRTLAETGLDTVIIALSANLVNLLDVRPGRARKAVILAAAGPAIAGSIPAQIVVGAAAGGLESDLRRDTMLGDLGANTLGAFLGTHLATYPPAVKVCVAATLTGLNAASEKVSFSRVIDETPVLRWFDRLGRAS
ncbi:hypothetical protein [Trueperella bialowiezensis]|uniref:Uncharacterized protein n=1 Tax=Trueperella bialowiezensis TaxID=312285 RepID=A0A448PBP7_9ACTO|nr:hypothetical protein [Trueperella bialowiezensis]VEI12336.1 Uncharacterised protein [Trueperella bialowiezensis]